MGIESDELITDVQQDREKREELATEALEWFLNQERIGEFYPRSDVVEELATILGISTNRANVAISDTVGDIVDPVQQITTSNTKYVGVIEYKTYPNEGAYGYVDFDDKKQERKRIVCAKCVENADYDEEVVHATQGEGTSNQDATWGQLLNKITGHYTESHTEAPSEIEPGASLVNGTTISGNTAFHVGNDGLGSNLTPDSVPVFQSTSDVSNVSEGSIVFIKDDNSLFVEDGT